MYTEFHIKADELNSDFLKKLKEMFRNKSISITIEEEEDETEYLWKSEANRKMLLDAIDQVDRGETVKIDLSKPGLNEKR